jgi:hypothetical protein
VPRLPPSRDPDVVTEIPSVISRAIERLTEKVVKFVTLEVQANLQAAPQEGGTPVKTGFARASWIPSVGQATDRVAGSRQAVNIGPSEAGAAEVMMYRLNQGAVFVSNNAPYIMKLNAGYSRQAPAGFVDNAIAQACNAASNAFGGGQ